MPSAKPKKILVAYSKTSTYLNTTLEYILAIKRFTSYEVDYVHVTHDAVMDFDINQYDVLFHNYCSRLCFENYVSKDYERAVHKFRGLKIISVQDDYDYTSVLHQGLRRLGFHALVSWLPDHCWPLAYPRSEVPGLALYGAFTGFMPESLVARQPEHKPLAERDIWIAYRGRDIGGRYGCLGYDKYEIGRRIAEICTARGIPHDIAMDDANRIYGDAWFDFLGSARAVLGVETGSNIFDYDGTIAEHNKQFHAEHGRYPSHEEIRHLTDPVEPYFHVGGVSARIFEAATMKTPMILYRGEYSGVVEPDKHYIPLEKDFSNIDQVIESVHDLDRLEAMATRTYEDVVASNRYGYKYLADVVERIIDDLYPVVINPDFLEFRRRTGAPYTPLVHPEEATNEAEARIMAFAERPTPEPLGIRDPLGSDEINSRYFRYTKTLMDLAEQARLAALPPPTEPDPEPEPPAPSPEPSPVYRVARGMWRTIPEPVRMGLMSLPRRLMRR